MIEDQEKHRSPVLIKAREEEIKGSVLVGGDEHVGDRGKEDLPHEQTEQTAEHCTLIVEAFPPSSLDVLGADCLIRGRTVE